MRTEKERVVAGMATMPTRLSTFPIALDSILHQVDLLYLYLDGHAVTPPEVRGDSRVITISSCEAPGLRAAGKFLGLKRETQPCIYLTVDDDIAYPPDYVSTLRNNLLLRNDQAVVGYHGSILEEPLDSYRNNRTVFVFDRALRCTQFVDVLGTGTLMFSSEALRFDVGLWRTVNMCDLQFAMEATRMGLPLVCLERATGYLRGIETMQPDSVYCALIRDDTGQTKLALELKHLRLDLGGHPKPA